MNDDEPSPNDSFMKRAKDAINLIVVGALCWVGNSVQQSTTQIAVLSVKVEALSKAVDEAKGSASDRYTSSSATADFRSRDAQISQNQSRIEDHEQRLRKLELYEERRK